MEVPRYHPFTPWDAQVTLTVGFSWTITCVPGAASEVALYLNYPWSCAYPDSFGFMRNCRSNFSVRLACGRSWHHRFSGKSLWVLANPEIKCPLKVQMDCSAEFLRWVWVGTNWNFLFTSLIKFLSTLGHSFYIMCRLGFKPLLVNRLWSFWYAVFKSIHVSVFKGFAWIVFES